MRTFCFVGLVQLPVFHEFSSSILDPILESFPRFPTLI